MSDADQYQLPVNRGPKPRNQRLRRGIYLLPGMLTVANMLCGYYAVLATLKGGIPDLDHAAGAIGIAILFDSADGWVARATGTSSEFGKQLDSLADVISFGVAPAFLAFAWGVRGMLQSDAGPARHIFQLGWLISFAFVICCAWRLARFNIQGMAPGGSRYFVGMPTPAAAGMIAATVHAWKAPIDDWRWAAAWLALVAGLAALMTSTVRHYSFKDIPWTRRQPSLAVVLAALLGGAIVFYSEEALLLIASSYTLSGITLHVVRVVRHRLVSRPA
ncbi:MAG: CDP-diacylglycerol--serine O-phosphatidyltransferase [Acidobacteria bacterium]|nr:CDP-diacylglycerol--serine O-phosphatidyltransferase [Acidobacteriota bacterium]